MRIQHNIMAMNAYRNYTGNVNAMKSNLEKLSSGYKINRAGDDAAGLAISEKMRAQITGLNAAQKNVKDGISLVQTAEGAMQEVQDMLNRMVYLATQSANGTYDNEVDRANLQKEMDQLRAEIDRISDSANFNGIKLLDGSKDTSVDISSMTAVTVTPEADGAQEGPTAGAKGEYTFDLKDLALTNTDATNAVTSVTVTIGGVDVTATVNVAVDGGVLSGKDLADAIVTATDAANGGTALTINNIVYDVTADDSGKVTLKAQTAGKPGVDLTVVVDTTNLDSNNGYDQAVHTVTAGVDPANSNKLAQGTFTLGTADITNGSAVKIGQETYIFQVGDSNPVTAGDGQKVIKLDDKMSEADRLKDAVRQLGQQNNKEFDITGDENTAGKIYLTEKAGAIDYAKSDYDLVGKKTTDTPAGTDTDATWKNVVSKGTPVQKNPNGQALTFQIGDTADSFNQLKVSIGDIHTKALGIDTISIADQDSAADAVEKIKAAINTVSSIRGDLGATQNRLEHTQNNLSVMQENITDAESSIRDTDVAEEMMAYTKNNILIQAAQAMLAQANQIPQGVLQLLQ